MSETMNEPTYYYNRPKWHYNRPSLLEEAIERCKCLNKKYKFIEKIGKLSKRQLDAIKSLCQAILHYTDISTLQYGSWDTSKGTVQPFDLKILRKVTGLSYHYFYKSIKRLKSAGYLVVKRVYRKILPGYIEKGTPEYKKAFRASPSIRTLSLSLFIDLGISKDRLQSAQRSVCIKREDQVRKEKDKRDYINKPTHYRFFKPILGEKHKNGASYISIIKDLLSKVKNHESGP